MFFGDKRRQEVSEDEIRTMVADNEELDDEEKRMIHEVMDLGDATAEEVMTPRVDMIMVGSDETVRQAIDRMRGTGYSRLPVFRDDDDDIIGIVRYKDLIDPLLEDKEDD
ncbi:MAG: CBS domain-containing protein, partial [Slackia isoflavoniconvertens]|nr:CBS domain-containing protein [Slackia isoflavoniconvertens]